LFDFCINNQLIVIFFLFKNLISMKANFSIFLFSVCSFFCNAQAWDFKNVNLQGMGYVTGLIAHPNPTIAPNALYARTDVGGIYKFDYNTERWQQLLDGVMSRDNNGPTLNVDAVALDPSNATTLYASFSGRNYYPNPAAGDILKSTDGGASWSSTGFLATNTMIDANADWRGTQERLTIDPNKPDLIYYASRTNGLWRKNGTADWQKVTGGLSGSSTQDLYSFPGYTFVVFDKNTALNGVSQTIYVGLWANGVWRSTDAGTTWSKLTGGGQNPTRGILNSTGELYVAYKSSGGIQKYNGTAWINITPSGQSDKNFMGISFDPNNPTTVIANTFNRNLFRSTNGGTSWTPLTMNWPAGSFPAYYNTYSPTYNQTFSPFDWGNTALMYDLNDPKQVWMSNGYCPVRTKNLGNGVNSDWKAEVNNLEEIVCIDVCVPPLAGGADLLAGTLDMVGWQIKDKNVVPTATIADFDFVAFGGSIDYCQELPQHACYVGGDQTVENKQYAGKTSNNGEVWTNFTDQSPGKGGTIAMSATSPQNMVWAACCGSAPVFTTNGGNSWSVCDGISASWLNGGESWYSRNLVADRVDGNRFYFVD
jgi:xyloglucan-specific exo-beta-1,4-glucanase